MRKSINYFSLMFLVVIVILISCSKKMSDFERGKKFLEVGDYDNAVKSFDLAIWEQPDNPDIRYHLAEALEKADKDRRAYRQYFISAKIGSKEISNRFTKRAWELYEKGDSDGRGFAQLAIIAYNKNAEAQFLYGQQQGYSGLPFLRDAIDWSSDKKIVEPTFKLLAANRTLLTRAFLNQITTVEDRYEEFGPVIFGNIKNQIIWSRAKKNYRGRYQAKDIKLYTRSLSDTTVEELTTVGTNFACPCFTADSLIYYSDGNRIYHYNLKEDSTTRLMNGVFPDISENGEQIIFTLGSNIIISDTAGNKIKALTNARRYYRYNIMPKFIHPKDSIIVFLSYRDGYLDFYQNDTSGTTEKKIATISHYGFNDSRPWLHCFDISPDGQNIVFSRNNRLYFLDIETGKEDTLGIYGAYPTFSPDGKKLTILTREYGETGEVAIVDLDEVFEAKSFFKDLSGHNIRYFKEGNFADWYNDPQNGRKRS